jgi:integrase
MKLTKRTIDQLAYDPAGPTQQIHFSDDGPPGFGIRVNPAGTKSFVLWYRTTTGRKRLHTIGRYGVLTVDQATAKARTLLGDVIEGADPADERQQARAAPTVRNFATAYMDRYAKPKKRSWRADQQMLDAYVLPAFGNRKLEEITRADVALFHHEMGQETPIQANRVLALLSTMFNLAEDWGFVPEGHPNPARVRRGQKFKERSRDRWISPDELPRLVEAIDAEANPVVRAAIRLYLLTGLRRNELLNLRWRDIDLERLEIKIPDTKAGRPHIVAITPTAEAILRSLPRGIGRAPVFPGEDPAKPLVNLNKPWLRIRARFWLAANPEREPELRRRAEIDVANRQKHAPKSDAAVEGHLIALAQEEAKREGEDIRLHDLRRTVGSWLAMDGASLPLIGKVLNHSNPSTTQVYARIAEDAARDALERHDAKIGPLLGIGAKEAR